MLIYNFNSETYEFTGTGEAMENPMSKGDYLIPAYATQLEPPSVGINEVAVFSNGINDDRLKTVGDLFFVPDSKWMVIPDFRGVEYYTEAGYSSKIEKLNEKIDWTTHLTATEFQEKPVKYSNFNFVTRKWTVNKEQLKSATILNVSNYRYTLQEATTLSNDIFSNKTATYNMQLQIEAINTFESGIPVRWRNLDGTRIDLTTENLPKLKELLDSIRKRYQDFFSAQEILEIEILAETNMENLINYEIEKKFAAALEQV